MSKAMAGVALVLLGGAAVFGGLFLANSTSSDKDSNNKTEEKLDYELPETLDKFKTEGHVEGCIKQLFSGVAQLGDSQQDMSSDDWSSTPTTFFTKDKDTKGCLIVNWDKKAKDSKWSGSFRLLWAVKGESKGFIVFLVGNPAKDTSGSNHKISWNGMGYLMTSTDTSDPKTWSVSKKSKVKDNATFLCNETEEKKFPQAGTILKKVDKKTAIENFWGWISGASDLSNIGTEQELTSPTTSSLKAYWEWVGKETDNDSDSQPSSTNKLLDWTQEFGKWWEVVFDKDKFKAKDASDKQKGTWSPKKYESTPAANPEGSSNSK